MKSIILNKFGGADQLIVGEIETPSPAADEVQIKIAYTAVNPVDWKIREGLLQSRMPHDFPIIPGWDAAGTISALGKNVKDFKIGDQVFAYCRKPTIKWGTYAEYVCLPANDVAFKPENISFAQAAAFPLAGLTAWQALFDAAQLKRGETVLIHAGAGGVGSLAIQFARHAGAYIYTTATESKHDYVKSLGADVAIDYKKENFASKIKSMHPAGMDVVFDTVGGQTLKDSYPLLKAEGRLVSIVEPPDGQVAEKYNIKVHYVFVTPNGKELQQISDLIAKEEVLPIQIEEMPLEKAGEAQEKNRAGRTTGKIVLKVI
jgi:NADPH2:quinone reductase